MLVEYPDNWREIVSKVKQRDLIRCVLCGSNKRLQVHHTRGKTIPENLITLCFRCHKAFANNYCGFKKKIRKFNDLRLNNNSLENIEKARLNLINDINSYTKRVMELRDKIRQQNHKTLDNF